MTRLSLLAIFVGVAASAGVLKTCQAGGAHIVGAGPSGICSQTGGPTGGNLLPGKYWEEEGGNRRDKEDTTGALEAFKRAAYYGNKDAQYDVAMMYMKGAKKVPVDITTGVAWLRLAAQYGHALSVDALNKLEPALTAEQREMSMRLHDGLLPTYGMAVTRNRVLKQFQLQRGLMAFADWICVDGMAMAKDTYLHEVNQEFADYVSTMFGTVTVEPIQSVDAPNEKK